MKAYKCSAGLVCLHRTESGVILIAHYAGQHEQPRIVNGALCWSRTTPHIIRRTAARAWRQKLAIERRKAARS